MLMFSLEKMEDLHSQSSLDFSVGALTATAMTNIHSVEAFVWSLEEYTKQITLSE